MRQFTRHQQPSRTRTISITRRVLLGGAVAVLAIISLVATSAEATSASAPSGQAVTHVVVKSAHFLQFRSPSKNIFCHIARGGGYNEARCDIRHYSFNPPPKPHSCHFDWGPHVRVAKRAGFACVSDPATESPHVPTLAYGDSKRLGHIRCTSRQTGMVCRNLNTGHGFKLARASVTIV